MKRVKIIRKKKEHDADYILEEDDGHFIGCFSAGLDILDGYQNLSHIYHNSKTGFFIFSTFIDSSEKENLRIFKKAIRDLEDANLSYWEIDVLYTYKCREVEHSEEKLSLLVPYKEEFGSFNDFADYSKKLAILKYNQENVFIKYPKDMDSKCFLVYADKKINLGTETHHDSFRNIYSSMLKGCYHADNKITGENTIPHTGKSVQWDDHHEQSLVLNFRISEKGFEAQSFNIKQINGYGPLFEKMREK